MYAILMVIYVVTCFALMISVLLQSAKGEGLAGAFGGGGVSGAVFGGRGAASFLSRATTVLAVLFMILAIVLSFLGPNRATVVGGPSAVQEAAQTARQSLPATSVPGAQPAAQGEGAQPGTSGDQAAPADPAVEELLSVPDDSGR